jgi:hypothetical protein
MSYPVGEDVIVFNSSLESLESWAAREVNIEIGG